MKDRLREIDELDFLTVVGSKNFNIGPLELLKKSPAVRYSPSKERVPKLNLTQPTESESEAIEEQDLPVPLIYLPLMRMRKSLLKIKLSARKVLISKNPIRLVETNLCLGTFRLVI